MYYFFRILYNCWYKFENKAYCLNGKTSYFISNGSNWSKEFASKQSKYKSNSSKLLHAVIIAGLSELLKVTSTQKQKNSKKLMKYG